MSAFAAYRCTEVPRAARGIAGPAEGRHAVQEVDARGKTAGIGIGDQRTRFRVAASSGGRNAAGGSRARLTPWEDDARTQYSHTREFSAFRTE